MPLEATMMIIDNSEYMRNGDYQPTRFDAQADAINVVFQTKVDSNPENTVGVMSMAGKGPEVLVTHSKDLGQILQAIHKTSSKIGGAIDIPTAIAVSQLALKHRENKNLRQRIIVFVGSPLDGPAADEKGMVKLAKKLKKNNVAVDIVCFGDGIEEPDAEGKTVLKSFVEAASSGDNSHYVTVPPGPNLISDVLITSPVLSEDRSASIPAELGGTGGSGPSGSTSNANDFEFGVDPSLDPELAMALRLSMQEAQAREAAENASAPASNAPETNPSSAVQPTSTTTVPADPTDDEEEAMLQQAIAMSQGEDVDMEGGTSTPKPGDVGGMDEDEEDEDAAIARAIAMSMEDQSRNQDKDKK
ncbi:multiubiquitin chain binding protein mbp1 [Moniliophthora roreri MCA 2997]|uniref:Multiubiquitin chain binding protein mbp1 n=2 Tax=Moniliophthora roreri TaxID=221103 RepID=V2WH95_MONRO|nr:multiubiquitin chain binding protein mbp1 [Moniliophthora roreri MCA 2997]KAI3619622.1 multiubiquitin chain binding protein mbp1 [Moniliophthora roreri]